VSKAREQLIYYPSVTREPFGETPADYDLMTPGRCSQAAGLPPFSIERDRIICVG